MSIEFPTNLNSAEESKDAENKEKENEQENLVKITEMDKEAGEIDNLEETKKELVKAIEAEDVSPSLREKLKKTLDSVKDFINPQRKKDENWKKENWENPNNPEGALFGLSKINSTGLTMEYPGGVKIKGKMEGDVKSFHKEGYNANPAFDYDYYFSEYGSIEATEDKEVLELVYPLRVYADDMARSAIISATIDKKNQTITFKREENRAGR
jgi:hypothetical protein